MGSFKDTYQRSFDHSSVQLVVDCEVRNPEICIAECQVFLAVLSENYQNSARHEKHFEMARRYKKCIIPVKGMHITR